MSEQLVQYEWAFLSPRSTFDFLMALNSPVSAKSVIYLVEALTEEGQGDPSVSFDWLHSRALERWFLYAEAADAGVTALRRLTASAPVDGVRLTVKQWDSGAEPGALTGHQSCWLWGSPEPGHPEVSVLTRGQRTEVAV